MKIFMTTHELKRAVITPSAGQVRQPIYKDSLEHWKNYEQELVPLKLSLGGVGDE